MGRVSETRATRSQIGQVFAGGDSGRQCWLSYFCGILDGKYSAAGTKTAKEDLDYVLFAPNPVRPNRTRQSPCFILETVSSLPRPLQIVLYSVLGVQISKLDGVILHQAYAALFPATCRWTNH